MNYFLKITVIAITLLGGACDSQIETLPASNSSKQINQTYDKNYAIAQLIKELNDSTKSKMAATKLMKFRHVAIPALLENLSAPSLEARYYTAYILSTLKDARITKAMYERLIDENEHQLIRTLAAQVMGVEGYAPAIKVITNLLNRRGTIDKETGKLTNPQIGDNIKFCITATRALGSIATPEVIPTLDKMLKHKAALVKEEAVTGLGLAQSVESIPDIAKLLESKNSRLLTSVLLTLGRFASHASGYAKDIIPLAAPTQTNSVRAAALMALKQITGKKFNTYKKWLAWSKGRKTKTLSEREKLIQEGVPLPAIEVNMDSKEGSSDGSPALKLPWE